MRQRKNHASEVVVRARAWIGTPYMHQQAARGAGCDCLGLVLGIWSEIFGPIPQKIPPYTKDWSEASGKERLWQAAMQYLTPQLTGEAAGDILLFRMSQGAVAKHLGIQTEIGPNARFIHAYCEHGVVETPLSQPWRRRVVARFVFP